MATVSKVAQVASFFAGKDQMKDCKEWKSIVLLLKDMEISLQLDPFLPSYTDLRCLLVHNGGMSIITECWHTWQSDLDQSLDFVPTCTIPSALTVSSSILVLYSAISKLFIIKFLVVDFLNPPATTRKRLTLHQ